MDNTEGKLNDRTADKAVNVYQGMKSIDKAASFTQVVSKINRRRKRRTTLVWSSVAAAALLFMAGGGLLYVSRSEGNQQVIHRLSGNIVLELPDGSEILLGENGGLTEIADYEQVTIRNIEEGGIEIVRKNDGSKSYEPGVFSTLTVAQGNQYDIILEDGTHVWLNSGSSLRFPNAFSGSERRVYLAGEAYFEVSYDAAKPFVVETDKQTLRVLGTEFNLYAYPGQEPVYTTLVSGSVSVTANDSGGETVLAPGQQAKLIPGAASHSVTEIDTAEISAWRNGMFAFNNNTLSVVMRKLARWYDFEYIFEDMRAADLEVMGNIPVYDDLHSVMEVLNASGLTEIKTTGNLVTIKMKK